MIFLRAPPDSGQVILDITDEIATLTIANERRRNAMSAAILDQLIEAATRLADDDEVRVVVLRGAHPRTSPK